MDRTAWPGFLGLVLIDSSALFSVLLTAAAFGYVEANGVLFGALAVVLALLMLAFVHLAQAGWARSASSPWTPYALGAWVAVAWGLRRLPYRDSDVPMGYDYGFYAGAFHAYRDTDQAVLHAPDWVQGQFPPGLPLWHNVLEGIGGVSAEQHLVHVWPLLAALLVAVVFVAVRERFGEAPALLSAALYAFSFTQFTAFEYLYEKNLLAMGLLVGAWFLTERRRWILAGVVLAAIAIWHRPTFLVAALAFAVHAGWALWQVRERRGWITTAATAIVLAAPVWIVMADTFFGKALQVAEGTGPALVAGGSSGTFFEFADYWPVAGYAFLALGAVLVQYRWRGPLLPLAGFTVAALWALLGLPLGRRFLIMMDLFAVVLAGVAAWNLLPERKWRPFAALAVVLVIAVPTVLEAWDHDPRFRFVDEDDRAVIAWMEEHLPPAAVVLADNLRSPYVIADSGRTTYGPGLFDDPHTQGEWNRMFGTSDEAFIQEFVAPYGGPLYVYQTNIPGPDFLQNAVATDLFLVHYQTDGARVYRYTGGNP